MKRAAALGLVVLGWTAATVASAQAPVERQTRHALVIGIGEYADAEIPALKGIGHDITSARRMAGAMGVPAGNVTVLRDRAATAERIRAEIDALNARVQDGDRVFVYYSGHGTRWYDEALKNDGCTEGLMASDGQVLSNVELGRRLAPLAQRADKMLVFYDACFSGGIAGAPLRTRSFTLGGEQITPKFTRAGAPELCAQPSNFRTRSLPSTLQQSQVPTVAQNVVHVAASRPDEASFDSSTQGGFATASWRDCLLGQAKDLDGSGAITADEVTRCAQAKIDRALAGQPGISGQQMTVAGNPAFVPAWMGESFAAPAAPASAAPRPAAPAQVLAEVHGQRDGGRRVQATVRKPLLKIGSDTLEVDVTPPRDGYLYVALAGSDGQSLYLLYPNSLATDNRVQAGRRVSLPGAGWEIVAAGPPGTETLLVMVADAPRDLSALAQEKAGPFMKTLLDGQGRARLQTVLGNGTPPAGCGRAGAPPCSDAFGAALLQVETVR
jgi:Caspase domain/Domain of unknown function (DUF4384)